jgi:hypothetical protein
MPENGPSHHKGEHPSPRDQHGFQRSVVAGNAPAAILSREVSVHWQISLIENRVVSPLQTGKTLW